MLALEASTVLSLGARGRWRGEDFLLAGRTCLRGRRGALWNEWRLRFDDGRTRFLAEAGGSFTLYDEGTVIPGWEALIPGRELVPRWIVVERGEARRVAVWGDTEPVPPTYRYADLSEIGDAGRSATIDFGAGVVPRVFVGDRVSLGELGLTASADAPRWIPAPDLSRPAGVTPWLEPGDVGDFGDDPVRIAAVVSRRVPATGAAWDEYVVASRRNDGRTPLRWLVVADGAFRLAEAVPAGRVAEPAGERAVLAGIDFHAVDAGGVAETVWVAGELPWAVAVGDRSSVRDYEADDVVLTREWTDDDLGWSRSEPLPTDRVARAFKKRLLPKPPPR